MTIDLDRVRQDTPGCQNVLHLNNAGAALTTTQVLEAVTGHLRLEAEIGGYEAAAREHERINNVYHAFARLLNCDSDEIAIIENATRAWDMAFYSIPLKPGDRILTAQAEYVSNFIAELQVARRSGATIEVIPNDEYGQISLPALERALDERVKLVAITHVPTNGGLVNPAAEVGRLAKQAEALYLLDACQSVGQMPLDVKALGCDFLSGTGRKFLRGPRGTGFLYARREILEQTEPVFLDLHAAEWTATNEYKIRPDARRFENWETYYAGKIGLGVAVDYALDLGLENIWQRVQTLANSLRAQLSDIPGVTLRDLGRVKSGIITFTKQGIEAEQIKTRLAAQGINVSVSILSSTRLDMEERGLNSMVRASVHYYNTEEEIARFCAALANL